MRIRPFLLVATLSIALSQLGVAEHEAGSLSFGQAYGSVGFLDSKATGTMIDAPGTVLVFSRSDGHRSLVLTDNVGDYLALLEPGRYCVDAYTKKGKPIQLGPKQLKCIDVSRGKDTRLDVMLVRDVGLIQE